MARGRRERLRGGMRRWERQGQRGRTGRTKAQVVDIFDHCATMIQNLIIF